ncbi:MAG: molybdopterin-dependent oxidoreductase, partial [Actinomycetota bacterium]|nr:molybdopterin-dependent oxidoreductase [Actinomycetota bacterium]
MPEWAGMTSSRLTASIAAPVAATVGLLSMAAGLALGHLVGVLISPTASPFLAVGSSAIDLTPAWLKDFAVATFGTYDKIVLLGGMAVVIAVIGAIAGLFSRRSPVPGLTLIVVLGIIASIAVVSRPAAGSFDLLAPLAGLVTSAGTFVVLHRLSRLSNPEADDDPTNAAMPARVPRRALLTGSAVAVGAGIAAAGGQLLARRGGVEASRQAVGRIVPTVPAPPIPPGADFASDGSPTFITPNRDFYRIDVNLTVPRLRAEDWRLRIHGMVDREITLSFRDLISRKLIEVPLTMTCVSNEIGGPYISTAY